METSPHRLRRHPDVDQSPSFVTDIHLERPGDEASLYPGGTEVNVAGEGVVDPLVVLKRQRGDFRRTVDIEAGLVVLNYPALDLGCTRSHGHLLGCVICGQQS